MAKVKFGFKTFIQLKHPIAVPKRPFDKKRDLRTDTQGLYIHLTPSNRVSKRTTGPKAKVLFCYYEDNLHTSVTVVNSETMRVIHNLPIDLLHVDETQLQEAA